MPSAINCWRRGLSLARLQPVDEALRVAGVAQAPAEQERVAATLPLPIKTMTPLPVRAGQQPDEAVRVGPVAGAAVATRQRLRARRLKAR